MRRVELPSAATETFPVTKLAVYCVNGLFTIRLLYDDGVDNERIRQYKTVGVETASTFIPQQLPPDIFST